MHNTLTRPGHDAEIPRWRLPGIALGVVAMHAALLHAAPQLLASSTAGALLPQWEFSTYTVTDPPAPPVATANLPVRTAPPPRQRRSSLEPPTPPQPAFEEKPVTAAENTDASAIVSGASATPTNQQPVSASADSVAEVQVAAAAPSVPTTPAGTSVQANTVPAPTLAVPARVVLPPPARLLYDVKGEIKGFPYHVNGELLWTQDGATYNARMEIRHFLLGSRVQTSTGTLSAQGLEPTRFGDKVKSEVAAHFERDKGKISFSANTPDAPLQPGAQDQLSVLVQVAALVAAQADHLSRGTVLAFQAVGPRSAEIWRFTVGERETLTLPGGTVQALRLWRDPLGDYDPTLEVWLAAEQGYLPVRIRLSQRNGDVVDQLWRETRKP